MVEAGKEINKGFSSGIEAAVDGPEGAVLKPDKGIIEKEREIVLDEIKEDSSLVQEKKPASGRASAVVFVPASAEEKKIERAMESGLEEIYANLPPDKQLKLKVEGEATARKINKLLHSAKVNFNKIVALIKKWLAIIPRVNKFFLEQESKIKADEIIRLNKEDN